MPEPALEPSLQRQVDAAVRAYRPLPPPAAPGAKLRGSRSWAWRVLWFPVTVRRFERVFYCQGESFVARWALALRFARTTVRT